MLLTTKVEMVFYDRAKEAGMNNEEADKWAEEQIGKEKEEWEAVDLMGLVPKLIELKDKNSG